MPVRNAACVTPYSINRLQDRMHWVDLSKSWVGLMHTTSQHDRACIQYGRTKVKKKTISKIPILSYAPQNRCGKILQNHSCTVACCLFGCMLSENTIFCQDTGRIKYDKNDFFPKRQGRNNARTVEWAPQERSCTVYSSRIYTLSVKLN
jgi:hypothetical protein